MGRNAQRRRKKKEDEKRAELLEINQSLRRRQREAALLARAQLEAAKARAAASVEAPKAAEVAAPPTPLGPSHTDDPSDPALRRGVDTEQTPQSEKYLVLSVEEREKGFIRPVRRTYAHVGPQGPKYPLRELTSEERQRFAGCDYVGFEAYPESESPKTGRYWTRADLDRRGCGVATTMSQAIAETYARDPKFYGSTYCTGCRMHLPVDEFRWEDGTTLGS